MDSKAKKSSQKISQSKSSSLDTPGLSVGPNPELFLFLFSQEKCCLYNMFAYHAFHSLPILQCLVSNFRILPSQISFWWCFELMFISRITIHWFVGFLVCKVCFRLSKIFRCSHSVMISTLSCVLQTDGSSPLSPAPPLLFHHNRYSKPLPFSLPSSPSYPYWKQASHFVHERKCFNFLSAPTFSLFSNLALSPESKFVTTLLALYSITSQLVRDLSPSEIPLLVTWISLFFPLLAVLLFTCHFSFRHLCVLKSLLPSLCLPSPYITLSYHS